MAQRTFPESGQDGRSVLGMLSVQVERDPKTGAYPTTTVFDDGRKSIHAVGGSGNQPSSEELGQILSIVDGVGMRVLLDEVTVTPEEVKMKNEDANKAPKGKLLSVFSRQNEEETPQDTSRSYEVDRSNTLDLKTQECSGNNEVDRSNEFDLKTQECSGNNEVDRSNEFDLKTQECSGNNEVDRSNLAVRDIPGEVDNVEDLNLEEGPVTLVFMGYSDQSQEEDEGPITVERVMINEEGEETVLGPQTPRKESKDVAEGGGTPKRKSCQCCSVM
ncbi:hypothetical protein KUCAC02_016396 [Chaenocephalus aceratus]|nr:hypothetical protein KUCAC02_016396 [Chaenocephalus aceratus]